MDTPLTAQVLKDAFNRHVSEYDPTAVYYTGKMEGAIAGILKRCAGSDANYRLVLKALTDRTSSKELSNAQWYAMWRFVKPDKPEGGKWGSGHGDEELNRWCNMLINAMVDVPEQTRFA